MSGQVPGQMQGQMPQQQGQPNFGLLGQLQAPQSNIHPLPNSNASGGPMSGIGDLLKGISGAVGNLTGKNKPPQQQPQVGGINQQGPQGGYIQQAAGGQPLNPDSRMQQAVGQAVDLSPYVNQKLYNPNLKGLDPTFQSRVSGLMGELKQRGYQPVIAEAMRTEDQQAQKVAEGNSHTMHSSHLTGKAMDVVDARYGWDDKKYGKEIDGYAKTMNELAPKYGLYSGTNWKSFGPRGDFAHLQMNDQNAVQQSSQSSNVTQQQGQQQNPSVSLATPLIKGFEDYTPKAAWDKNAYRAGYGSDTTTDASGQVRKVTPGMQVSQQDAERDLQRRIPEFQRTVQSQVGQSWNTLPPNVQAALTSVAYNYGSLPPRILQSVKSGDVGQISNAVRSLGSDDGGENRGRRNKEADYILSQNM